MHQALISISLSSLYDKLPDSSPLDVFITSQQTFKTQEQEATYNIQRVT